MIAKRETQSLQMKYPFADMFLFYIYLVKVAKLKKNSYAAEFSFLYTTQNTCPENRRLRLESLLFSFLYELYQKIMQWGISKFKF